MDPILGQIILWPVPWVPQGWALCDGSLLPVNQYQALYTLIGNTYGGTYPNNFALPDLRNRVPLGTQLMTGPGVATGAATSTVSATGTGAISIGVGNLPSHSHTAAFTPTGGGAASPVTVQVVNGTGGGGTVAAGSYLGAAPAGGAQQAGVFYPGTPAPSPTSLVALGGVSGGGGGITGGTVTVANTGGGAAVPVQVTVPVAVSTLQPALSMNFIIAVVGLYPQRP